MNVVETKSELISALASAGPGEIVIVQQFAKIDLSGEPPVGIPAGVTLLSRSALLFSDEIVTTTVAPMLQSLGPNVKVAGLRLRGPTTGVIQAEVEANPNLPDSECIRVNHPDVQVGNCEIWGWSHAGVRLDAGAVDAYIHHNNIHHCQRWGLGYGIWVDGVHPLIEANDFDWGRHAIAGSGVTGTGYEIRYNTFGKNFYHNPIDMHDGGSSGRPDPGVGGSLLLIHDNLILSTDEPTIAAHISQIHIGGIPAQWAVIYNNRFAVELQEDAIGQRIDGADRYENFVHMCVHDNELGFQSASKWHST